MTLRIRGHYEGDRQRYRGLEEPDVNRSRDPVAVLKNRAPGLDWPTLERDAAVEVESAFAAALAEPAAGPEVAFKDVWA
jgi:pyruvate dehydrogenase E1 component alpha subunit